MFKIPNLPYTFDALEPYIDKETMHLHHDKHHATYVKNLNEVLSGQDKFLKMNIEELIKSLEIVPENIRTKVKNNGGGHLNHSFFWKIMGPNMREPSGKLADAINNAFGGFDDFRQKFTQTALGRFGSGWTWLVLNRGKLEIMDTSNQDSPLTIGKKPILAIDVWEHAYYLKYQNRKADYIAAWFNVVNWREVERNYLGSK